MHDKLNVVLLTVDSMRADHLGCYGYGRPTSPFMDELAGQGVVADRFFTPAIPTQPSYTTLLTGQYPTTHNIVTHQGHAELSHESPMVSEAFVQNGYATCSLDNLWRQRYWFGRGFEYIIDPGAGRNRLLLVECDTLNRRAIPWIREHREEPFFLFMHYWDPHWPYVPPAKYRDMFYEGNAFDPDNHSLDHWYSQPIGAIAWETWLRTPRGVVTDANYVAAQYDQEIRYQDDGIRDVVTAIDELGLAEQTLVIVMADHGESMTEHGIYFGHNGLYDNVTRVPMIMRLPGRLPAGLRLPRMLQTVDIAPTVLDAAGVSIPPTMEGKSFWRMAAGETADGGYDAVISMENTWQAGWSIRTDHYKLILGREANADGEFPRELFDLDADPGEDHNLIAERPDVAAALEKQLEDWIAERMRLADRELDPLIEQRIPPQPRLVRFFADA